MEIAPELQFKHCKARQARLPADALVSVDPTELDGEVLCCDVQRHVFNPDHTNASVARALRHSHWLELGEWLERRARGSD
jgi:hypothetical protein